MLKKVGAESVVVDQKATPELNVLTGKTFDAETAEKAGTSFDGNMLKFGYADENKPSSIAIYASSFADKDYIESFIAGYNEKVESEGNTKD